MSTGESFQRFKSLEADAQKLLVRLLNRKGVHFRIDKLHYAEIKDLDRALAELEEERELARRRMSACILLTVFVLFKLWIDCIQEPSLPLLMGCRNDTKRGWHTFTIR